jgi:hypothetical protein
MAGAAVVLLLAIVGAVCVRAGTAFVHQVGDTVGDLAAGVPDPHRETQIVVAAMRELSVESSGFWRATSVHNQGVMTITDVNQLFGVTVGIAEGICTFPFRADYGIPMRIFPEPTCTAAGCTVTVPPAELMAVEPDTSGWKCTWDTSFVPSPLSSREQRAVTAITEVARSQASAPEVMRRLAPQVEQEYRLALEAAARLRGLRLGLLPNPAPPGAAP